MKQCQLICLTFALTASLLVAADPPAKHPDPLAPMPDPIPLGGKFSPKPEQGVFVTASSGGRILVSRDDGKIWQETLLATSDPGDGDHGPWGFVNLQYDNGLLAAFFGWTGGNKNGRIIASDDGKVWTHISSVEKNLPDSTQGMAARGVLLQAATPWSMRISRDLGNTWVPITLPPEVLKGLKTHHMKAAYGDYEGGRMIILGDGLTGFYSKDLGKTWSPSVNEGAPTPYYRSRIVFGNGVFVYGANVDKSEVSVGVSRNGGETWQKVIVGVENPTQPGLSFVKGEFWLTGRKHPKASQDGVAWHDLPETIPSGSFAESETGTLVCVSAGEVGTIRRSVDGGKTWEVTFKHDAPKEAQGTWRFRDVIYGKVKAIHPGDHAPRRIQEGR